MFPVHFYGQLLLLLTFSAHLTFSTASRVSLPAHLCCGNTFSDPFLCGVVVDLGLLRCGSTTQNRYVQILWVVAEFGRMCLTLSELCVPSHLPWEHVQDLASSSHVSNFSKVPAENS